MNLKEFQNLRDRITDQIGANYSDSEIEEFCELALLGFLQGLREFANET